MLEEKMASFPSLSEKKNYLSFIVIRTETILFVTVQYLVWLIPDAFSCISLENLISSCFMSLFQQGVSWYMPDLTEVITMGIYISVV